jgi:predicted RNA-binding Zn ribbon-like protein
MVNQRIDGLLLPVPVAGHPALELCNTRAGWQTDNPREYLTGYAELTVWARENHLLPPTTVKVLLAAAAENPRGAGAVLRSARAFREDLYASLVHGSGDATAAAVRTAARAVADANPVADRGWHLAPTDTLRAPLDAFAIAALPLLQDGRSVEVHRCAGAGCGWLFRDPTHRRRWCTMAVCGNRAKVRRFAERQRVAD